MFYWRNEADERHRRLHDLLGMQAIHRVLPPERRIAVSQVADSRRLHQRLDQANVLTYVHDACVFQCHPLGLIYPPCPHARGGGLPTSEKYLCKCLVAEQQNKGVRSTCHIPGETFTAQ